MKIENKKITFNISDISNPSDSVESQFTYNGTTYDVFEGTETFTLICKSKNRKIKVKKIAPYVPEIIVPSGKEGSFPQGTSSDNFVLIYHLDNDYCTSLNVDDLNNYAYTYLENLGEDVDRSVLYYQEDSNGIFVYITKEDGTSYDNTIVSVNGVDCYKVYIKGTADIIGFQRESGASGKYNLQLSNGYYETIANSLYLFVSCSVRLVHVVIEDETPISFYYDGESLADMKSFTDNSIYEEGNYYISIGSSCTISTIKEPAVEGDTINYVFLDGDIDEIITSNTMTQLEHFADIVNASKIVLSENIKVIGNYCFYGSNVSGTISLETQVLEEIGDYAFANMSNLNLLNINSTEGGYSNMPASLKRIGKYAFSNSAGLKRLSLLSCIHLVEVGEQAFANCGNLRNVIYRTSQVEPDEDSGTSLIYLPPEVGSDGNYAPRKNGTESITARYLYDYDAETANPIITDEEKNNSTKTFYNDSNITWKCY